MRFLVIPNSQMWPTPSAICKPCRSHKGIDSSTEPDLRKGISNDDAHEMVGEDGEMPGKLWTLFRERSSSDGKYR